MKKDNTVVFLLYLLGFSYLGWKLFNVFTTETSTVIYQEIKELWLIQGILVAILFVLIGIGYEIKRALK